MDGVQAVAFEPGAPAAVWLAPLAAPLAAALVAFVTTPVGVSGAFLLVPFQVSVLGLAGPSVSATNLVYNLVAIPAGVYRYHRDGWVLWSLAGLIAAGSVPGVLLGWYARVHWLAEPLAFQRFIAAVLLLLAARLAAGLWWRRAPVPADAEAAVTGEVGQGLAMNRWRRPPPGGGVPVASPPVLGVALLVAAVGTAYGVGGGSLMAPLLVSLFGFPVRAIAGATLLSTLLTSLAGVLAYALLPAPAGLATAPDWGLGLLMGAGGMVGAYLGAREQRRLPARALEGVLAGVVALAAFAYGWGALPGRG